MVLIVDFEEQLKPRLPMANLAEGDRIQTAASDGQVVGKTKIEFLTKMKYSS